MAKRGGRRRRDAIKRRKREALDARKANARDERAARYAREQPDERETPAPSFGRPGSYAGPMHNGDRSRWKDARKHKVCEPRARNRDKRRGADIATARESSIAAVIADVQTALTKRAYDCAIIVGKGWRIL
jgi:hypothetical protein